MTDEIKARIPAPSLLRRCARILKRIVRAVLLLILLVVAIVLVGLIPVNNDFESTPDGIEILLVSSAIHADIVLPIKTEAIDWRERFPAECFVGDTSGATHVAIGWGDKGFFIDTPTWADLRFSTAANALLWPSGTCMHVSLTNAEYLGDGARSVKISRRNLNSWCIHQRQLQETGRRNEHSNQRCRLWQTRCLLRGAWHLSLLQYLQLLGRRGPESRRYPNRLVHPVAEDNVSLSAGVTVYIAFGR